MDYSFTPQYWRARLEVFKEAISNTPNDSPDIALLRNGVMRDKGSEKMLSEARMQEKEFPSSKLTLIEQCSFNNWFAAHPEKICGEEIITTSREFPISVKGDKDWIVNTIEHALGDGRLILPVPFEWRISYFDPSDPDFDVEYTNDKFTARIYQGGVDYNLQITEGDWMVDNINYMEFSEANLHLMKFMQQNRGTISSKTLELEALALEVELQISDL